MVKIPSAEELFTGAILADTIPTAQFPNIGDRVTGIVDEVHPEQQRNFETGKPVFRMGSPLYQINVTLIDSLGDRFLLVVRIPSNLFESCKTALRLAKQGNFERGQIITVVYEDDQDTRPGLSPAKIYSVKIEPAQKAVA